MPTPFPIDSSDVLLLHGNGTDGSTTIIDSSLSPKSPTVVGAAEIDTAFRYFPVTPGEGFADPASIHVPGVGDYVTVPDSTDWDVVVGTTNDFMIDFWVRFDSVSGNRGLFGQYQLSNRYWGLYWDQPGQLLTMKGDYTVTKMFWRCAFNPTAGVWYHIAVGRSSTTRYMFINGVAQTLVSDANKGMSGPVDGPFNIGYWQRNSYYGYAHIEEFRFAKDVTWTSNFTPPTHEYGYFVTPVDSEIDALVNGSSVSRDRFVRKKRNAGFMVSPGLEVPVPIKMDRWQNLSQPPVRRKKRNTANTTQVVFVDFSIPTLPPVTIDQWLPNFGVPPRKKPFVRPSEYKISFIAALNPVNGNYWDSGNVRFDITVENPPESVTYVDTGEVGLAISNISVEDFQLEETGAISFTIKYPEVGNEVFNSGVPGFVSANVIINGVNESDWIQGTIQVTREDNTAARFRLSIEEDPDRLIPRKPVEFVNKVVQISFAAADMDGVVADYIPIFIGIVKGVSFNEDQRTVNLSGYDYSGIHQTKGEYISENITTVFEGAVSASSDGTINTGQSPIWGVQWQGNSNVQDGEDYFVDTENGLIVIPISSRILQFPGTFKYNYANPFDSMKAIIQGIAGKKNWTLKEDGVTIADYTNQKAHPVLSLSDESVIDTTRKFLELSGAKVEGNLFPDLRVYSEFENWVNNVDTITLDEDAIFENTLVFEVDFDNLLNEQTVRSVQKVHADIVIGGQESLAEFEGSQGSINPFTIQGGSNINNIDYQTPAVLVEKRIRKTNVTSISIVSSGTFSLLFGGINDFNAPITGSSWNWFIDGEDFVIQLKHRVVTAGGIPAGATGFFSGFSTVHAYPAVDYTMSVFGTKINYSGGTPEDVRVVTAQRPVAGITETLRGDVYENPYIETDTHCANICNAILLEHGNPYTTQFEIPVFEGKDMKIGGRIDIKRAGNVIFSGMIKRLNYSMNLEGGQNHIHVRAKGVGRGI